MEIDEQMQVVIDKVMEQLPELRMCFAASDRGICENPDFLRLKFLIKNGHKKSSSLLKHWDAGTISFETFMGLCGVSLEQDASIPQKKELLIEQICMYKRNKLQLADDGVTELRDFWKKASLKLLRDEAAQLGIR